MHSFSFNEEVVQAAWGALCADLVVRGEARVEDCTDGQMLHRLVDAVAMFCQMESVDILEQTLTAVNRMACQLYARKEVLMGLGLLRALQQLVESAQDDAVIPMLVQIGETLRTWIVDELQVIRPEIYNTLVRPSQSLL
jgi:hypothetical protein